MPCETHVPTFSVDTIGRPFDEACSAVRQVFEGLFSVDPMPKQGFGVAIEIQHFSRFMLLDSQLDSARYRRDPLQPGVGELNHLLLHIPLSGGVHIDQGRRVRPGDVVLLDFTQTADFHVSAGRSISLVIPRSELPVAQSAQLHGLVLRRFSASANLLTSMLSSLAAVASQLDDCQRIGFGQPLLDMISACLARHLSQCNARPAVGLAELGGRVRCFIEHNLHRNDLTSAVLAKAVGTSRSQLYRVFERFGGVHRYVQQRRLRRCLLALGDRHNAGLRIGELAYAHGFVDEAHFSKAFRKAFGMTPGAARSAARHAVSLGQPVCDAAQVPVLARLIAALDGSPAELGRTGNFLERTPRDVPRPTS